MNDLSITRKKLIKLAFKAIKNHKNTVSLTDQNHLLYAACTMHEVALNSWAIDNRCGCLVGTMLLRQGLTDEEVKARMRRQIRTPLYNLGIQFDKLLRKEVDPSDSWIDAKVQVID